MENMVYRLDHDKWKSLMVSGGYVNLSSKKFDTPVEFLDAIASKGLLESQKRIPVAGITQLSMLLGRDDLRLHWLDDGGRERDLSVEFSDGTDARNVAGHLAAQRDIQLHERGAGVWRAIKLPLALTLGTGALTSLAHAIAVDQLAGNEIHISGRKSIFKLVLSEAARVLGPTGTLVVGGVLTLLFGLWLFKSWKRPPQELVWR